MLKKKFIITMLLLGALAITISCDLNDRTIPRDVREVIKSANKNGSELQKVIDYYKLEGDSLKVEAAYFIIRNMPGHYSLNYEGLNKYNVVFDSVGKIDDIGKKKKNIFIKLTDSLSIKKHHQNRELIFDIDTITSSFLIENIELAFDAWQRTPLKYKVNFDEFCKGVLPYRTTNELLEFKSRRNLFNEYCWVYDSLERDVPMIDIITQIITQFDFFIALEIHEYYPTIFTVSQTRKTKFGVCSDGVNYFTHLFRAIGIPCSYNYIMQWGNYKDLGHSFIGINTKLFELYTGPSSVKDVKEMYAEESLPKVYRKTFQIAKDNYVAQDYHSKDVTNEFKKTANIDCDIILNRGNLPKIGSVCVFKPLNGWTPISVAKIRRGKLKATNLGTQVIYMPGYFNESNFSPVNYPIHIDEFGKSNIIKPSILKYDSIILYRKYPVASPRHIKKLGWKTLLNKCIIQGANKDDFSDAKTIWEVDDFNSTHMQFIHFNEAKNFKLFRIMADEEAYIAEFQLFDNHHNLLKGEVFGLSSEKRRVKERAFDNNPITYFGGKKHFYAGLKFSNTQSVKKIGLQARNDDNHINIGEHYELLYWDKEWISLGDKQAKDTFLVYKDVPKNSLFWLKNLSKGKEEYAFIIKNDKQFWPGSFTQ